MVVAMVNNTINQDTFAVEGRKLLKAEIQDVAVIDLMTQVVLNVVVAKSLIVTAMVVAMVNNTTNPNMFVAEGRKLLKAEIQDVAVIDLMTQVVLNVVVAKSLIVTAMVVAMVNNTINRDTFVAGVRKFKRAEIQDVAVIDLMTQVVLNVVVAKSLIVTAMVVAMVNNTTNPNMFVAEGRKLLKAEIQDVAVIDLMTQVVLNVVVAKSLIVTAMVVAMVNNTTNPNMFVAEGRKLLKAEIQDVAVIDLMTQVVLNVVVAKSLIVTAMVVAMVNNTTNPNMFVAEGRKLLKAEIQDVAVIDLMTQVVLNVVVAKSLIVTAMVVAMVNNTTNPNMFVAEGRKLLKAEIQDVAVTDLMTQVVLNVVVAKLLIVTAMVVAMANNTINQDTFAVEIRKSLKAELQDVAVIDLMTQVVLNVVVDKLLIVRAMVVAMVNNTTNQDTFAVEVRKSLKAEIQDVAVIDRMTQVVLSVVVAKLSIVTAMVVAAVKNTINQNTFAVEVRKSLKAEIQDVAVIDLMTQVVLNVVVAKSLIVTAMVVAMVNNTINQDTFAVEVRKSLKAEIQDVAVIDLMTQVVLNVVVAKSLIVTAMVVAMVNNTINQDTFAVEVRKLLKAEIQDVAVIDRMTQVVLNVVVAKLLIVTAMVVAMVNNTTNPNMFVAEGRKLLKAEIQDVAVTDLMTQVVLNVVVAKLLIVTAMVVAMANNTINQDTFAVEVRKSLKAELQDVAVIDLMTQVVLNVVVDKLLIVTAMVVAMVNNTINQDTFAVEVRKSLKAEIQDVAVIDRMTQVVLNVVVAKLSIVTAMVVAAVKNTINQNTFAVEVRKSLKAEIQDVAVIDLMT